PAYTPLSLDAKASLPERPYSGAHGRLAFLKLFVGARGITQDSLRVTAALPPHRADAPETPYPRQWHTAAQQRLRPPWRCQAHAEPLQQRQRTGCRAA